MLKQVDAEIAAHAPAAFDRSYHAVVATCNECHAAARHPFIHIAMPAGTGAQWNQDFEPPASGGKAP